MTTPLFIVSPTITPIEITTPSATPFAEVLRTGPQGPGGQVQIVSGVAVDLTTGGAQLVYTAPVGARVTVLGAIVRPTTVSGFVTGAAMYFRRGSDNRLYIGSTPANTLNDTDEALTLGFWGGVIPVLTAGQTCELFVSTPANAGTLDAVVALFGIVEVA
jgi:hypothetical protein